MLSSAKTGTLERTGQVNEPIFLTLDEVFRLHARRLTWLKRRKIKLIWRNCFANAPMIKI